VRKQVKHPIKSNRPPILPYPKRKSEFEYQAELFAILKRNKLDVRGEVPCHCKYGNGVCDLVIFENQQPILIIEVKNSEHKDLVDGTSITRQRLKYAEFKIPVIYYTTLHSLEHILDRIEDALNNQ